MSRLRAAWIATFVSKTNGIRHRIDIREPAGFGEALEPGSNLMLEEDLVEGSFYRFGFGGGSTNLFHRRELGRISAPLTPP